MSKEITPHHGTGSIIRIPNVGIILAAGKTKPADAKKGYATGCLFIHTDGGDGTALYVNEGTVSSADFNALDGA